jgi:transglutaminase-like putative cysteine protease
VLRNRSLPAWGLAIVVGACGSAAFAQSAAPTGPAPGSPAPFVIKLAVDDISVESGGLYTDTQHMEISPTNEAAAKSAGQQTLTYSEVTEDLEVTEAYTLKGDGSKLPVDPSKIFVQAAPGARAPMFDDVKSKVIVFPDVTANDTLVFTTVRHAKEAHFPGQFFRMEIFPRAIAWNEVRISISVPKSLPLRVETHDLGLDKQMDGDRVVYRWHYSAPMPKVNDLSAIALVDREPRLFASTFKSYEDLGRAYAEAAAPKSAVTPKIQAQADEITAGVTDKRAQTQKIYEWVSNRIRYVGIELGRGRVVPHDAETVLTNAYGDCKDHVALLEALLAAKGIRSEPVLINSTNSYALPEPPTLAQFNHVITWLPDLKMYVDTTAVVAPFGTLPFVEYGKPVVHALVKGSARKTLPVLASGEATMSLKTATHMTADGKMQGESTTTATGPFSVMLRQAGTGIQAAGSERVAQEMLRRIGMTGTASVDLATPPAQLAPSYAITLHYDGQPNVPWVVGQGYPMPPGIRMLPFAGDLLAGPLTNRNLPATEPTPCWSGTAVEDLSIEPPPGKHFGKLPPDTDVTTDNLSFTARWKEDGRVVSVHREFKSKMNQALCADELRTTTAGALAKIAAAYPLQISLADD